MNGFRVRRAAVFVFMQQKFVRCCVQPWNGSITFFKSVNGSNANTPFCFHPIVTWPKVGASPPQSVSLSDVLELFHLIADLLLNFDVPQSRHRAWELRNHRFAKSIVRIIVVRDEIFISSAHRIVLENVKISAITDNSVPRVLWFVNRNGSFTNYVYTSITWQ